MSRPRYTWRYFDTALSNLLAGGNLSFDIGTVGNAPDLADLGVIGDYTVRRLHMLIGSTSENNGEATTLDGYVWGVGVISQDAFNAGVFPDPKADAYDWLAFGGRYVPLSSAGGLATNHPYVQEIVDNRSMRKVNENSQALVIILDNPAVNNVATISIRLMGRLLVSHGQR